jgi:hypothetical protein
VVVTDQHVVTTGQGQFRFGIDGGGIVIERLEPSPSRLGWVGLEPAFLPTGSAPPASFGGSWALACPSDDPSADLRIYFGISDTTDGGRYTGPPASGSFTDDGLWMFVLEPGELDPDAKLVVETRTGGFGMPAGNFDLIANDASKRQPSGCYLA